MIIYRKFEIDDENQIRKICQDNAQKPFNIKEDLKKAISIMYLDYYIKYEKENIIIAYDDIKKRVCGYCTCYMNWIKYDEIMHNEISPKLKKIRAYLGIFNELVRKEDKKLYDSFGIGSFHINIKEEYQGKQIGKTLLTKMGIKVKENGGKYLYLVTKNRKTTGCSFYKHFGFDEVSSFVGGVRLSFNLNNLNVD